MNNKDAVAGFLQINAIKIKCKRWHGSDLPDASDSGHFQILPWNRERVLTAGFAKGLQDAFPDAALVDWKVC